MTTSARKKAFSKKKIIFLAFVLVMVIVGALLLYGYLQDRELKTLQNEKLQELINRRGDYDEQSIMLVDTSQRAAQILAEKTGATLRITKDGSFATLTLPDGVTIVDIYGIIIGIVRTGT